MTASRNRFRSAGPNMPLTLDGNHVERVATYPPGHVAEVDSDGNLQIYRRKAGTADTTDIGGITDTRPSKLREALARINERNRDYYATRRF
jgi:hypothetical protein